MILTKISNQELRCKVLKRKYKVVIIQGFRNRSGESKLWRDIVRLVNQVHAHGIWCMEFGASVIDRLQNHGPTVGLSRLVPFMILVWRYLVSCNIQKFMI